MSAGSSAPDPPVHISSSQQRIQYRAPVRLGLWMPRLSLIVPLVLGVACSPETTPSDSASLASASPESQLVEVVPATEQRPYSFMLPEGWSVEETVHSDGGSFVIASGDSPSAGGKVYGVIEPSGKITKYVPPPSSKDIRAIEADGSEATEPVSITVSGRPAWRMLVTSEDPQPLSAMFVEVDAGEGVGLQLNFFWASDKYSEDLFTEIIESVEIDETLLESAIKEADA
jgi:hypothetical protein